MIQCVAFSLSMNRVRRLRGYVGQDYERQRYPVPRAALNVPRLSLCLTSRALKR